jgi:hypothetical protein
MKEFQAENERRRTITEDNPSMLLNASSNEMILQSNDQSIPSTPSSQYHSDQQLKTTNQMKVNTLERRSTFDRNKLNIKTHRFAYDTLKVRYFEFISNINQISYLYYRHLDVQTMLHMNQMLLHRIIIYEVNNMIQ